ncbi:MAG: hypothetical protein Ta2B_25300 [Termitinemataceae bacterium]|nr:MAG: hypothetical protein Ta2B_25300 [Termitinemataceae bacterium]
MKKFKFNLEKILKLRSWNENDAKVELGRAVSSLAEIENNIKIVAQKKIETSNEQYASIGENKRNGKDRISTNNISDFRIYDSHIKYLQQQTDHLLQEAAAAEMEVEAKREQWVEKKSELKIMENLKDKRFAQYKKDSLKEME